MNIFRSILLQKPSASPTETVRTAIENQMNKEYTIGVHVEEVIVDEEETARVAEMYTGSDLAKKREWYDHTRTFQEDGCTEQYFYFTRDPGF